MVATWIVAATFWHYETGRFFQLLGNDVTHTGYMSDPLQDKDVTKSTSPLDNTTLHPNSDPYVSAHVDFSVLNGRLSDLIGTQFYVNCWTDDYPKTVKFTDEAGISVQKTTRFTVPFSYNKEEKVDKVERENPKFIKYG